MSFSEICQWIHGPGPGDESGSTDPGKYDGESPDPGKYDGGSMDPGKYDGGSMDPGRVMTVDPWTRAG